jgi:hypothetical protein
MTVNSMFQGYLLSQIFEGKLSTNGIRIITTRSFYVGWLWDKYEGSRIEHIIFGKEKIELNLVSSRYSKWVDVEYNFHFEDSDY